MKKLILTLLAAITPLIAFSQYQPWAVQWLQCASTAEMGRNCMGITNWPGSGGTTNYIPGLGIAFTYNPPYTYEISAPVPAPPPPPELTGDVESGPGYGAQVATVTNVSPLGLAGQVLTATGTGITWKDLPGCVGLSITQHMTDFLIGAITNVFSNGLLVATGPYVTPGGEFLIQPAGLGYLLQPSGDRFLLP